MTGTVTNSQGQAVSDYTLIVYPTDQRYWLPQSRRIRSVRPATDGTFTLTGLPAGEYRIAPELDPEPGSWFDASFLQQLDSTSQRFSLTDGEKKTLSAEGGVIADSRHMPGGSRIESAGRTLVIRALGLLLSLAYAVVIVWLYAAQPQTMAEVTGGLASQVGVYRIDDRAFADGLAFFAAMRSSRRARRLPAPIPPSVMPAPSSTSPTASTVRAGAASTATTRCSVRA